MQDLNNKQVKLLVIGDIMLDEYWSGDVERVSPEAPVPVLKLKDQYYKLGGAGNVASNISSLDIVTHIIGAIGEDDAANRIISILDRKKISHNLFVNQKSKTIRKLRAITSNHQLLRIDTEGNFNNNNIRSFLLDSIKQYQNLKVIICSDYAKGMLDNIEEVIDYGNDKNIMTIVDPKGSNFNKYKNATLLTPNLKEFEEVVGKCSNLSDLEIKAISLRDNLNLTALLVTRGKDGMSLFEKDAEPFHLKASAKEVSDVTGAGDTVIGVIGGMLSLDESLKDSVIKSNKAAGIVVTKFGAASVSMKEISNVANETCSYPLGYIPAQSIDQLQFENRNRNKTLVMTNGCFDILHKGHVKYLEKAKSFGDHLIVLVNDDKSVSKLKGLSRPINTLTDRVDMLLALESVDAVISFSEDTPEKLYELIKPDVLVKGADYKENEIAGADIVVSNGGKIKLVEFVEGVSTSTIIKKIKKDKE